MKKLVLSAIITVGLTASLYAQGILLKNTANANNSTAATSGGLVWVLNGSTYSLFDGVNQNLGLEVLAGPAGNLSSLGTFYPGAPGVTFTGDSAGMFALFPSQSLNTGVGVNDGIAQVQLNAWWYEDPAGAGTWNTFAQAKAAGEHWGTVTFMNATGTAAPPNPDQTLTGMPALILAVPEPSTFALIGLGMGAVCLLRRRK